MKLKDIKALVMVLFVALPRNSPTNRILAMKIKFGY